MSKLASTQVPSFWDIGVEKFDRSRPAIPGDIDCDVLIVGGGYTGLWTAHYVKQQAPSVQVVVAEAETIGHGASGRNGGWLSHLVPGNRGIFERGPSGLPGVIDLQQQMIATVDEVLKVAKDNSLDIDAHKSGNIVLAANEAGMERLRRRRTADLRAGLDSEQVQLLTANYLRDRINVTAAVGGLFVEPVARIHPGKLVRQLANLVEDQGAQIFEQTRVTSIEPHEARANGHRINAQHILICTEGFSGPLLGRRAVIPIKSSMIATQPLSDSEWDQVGWNGAECLSDTSHTYMYAQRTADGRITVGGRGKPYHYGSKIDPRADCHPTIVQALVDRLEHYFPDVRVEAAYGWSGSLGVSRDWCASVKHDHASGVGMSVGYAGHGVASSNLAARTLVDLVLGTDTERTRLPFVDHQPPKWEPEPIRWVGVQSMYRLFRTADYWEEKRRAQKTSLIARFAGRLAGLGD